MNQLQHMRAVNYHCSLLITTIVIGACFVILEWAFIKKNNKGAWILPIVITCISLIMVVSSSVMVTTRGGIHSIFTADDELLRFLDDYDGNTVAVGQLIVGDMDSAEYIELEFKDGELIGSESAMAYKKFLENELGRYTKGFTGKSVTYGELMRIRDSGDYELSKRNFSSETALRTLPIYGIFPLIIWLMFVIDRRRRSKKREADTIKIIDL